MMFFLHSTYNVKALQENPVVWLSFVLQTWYQHPMSNQQYQSTKVSQSITVCLHVFLQTGSYVESAKEIQTCKRSRRLL